MKTKLFFTFFLIALPLCASAAILVFSPNGTYTTKTTLSQVVTSADTVGKTVVVTSALSSVQSNISSATVHKWPATIALRVEKGGVIGNTTKFDLTGAAFESGMYQSFSGNVTGLSESRPEWFGTNTTPGTTDMSTAISKAIAAAPRVIFSGTYYVGSKISLPNRRTELIGKSGATINATGGITIFEQVNHPAFTYINGLTFTGNNTAFAFNAPSTTASYYMQSLIENCDFNMGDTGGVYALSYKNGREHKVSNSRFATSSYGVYSQSSQVDLSWSWFDQPKVGFNCDGLNDHYSQGSKLENVYMVGGEVGAIFKLSDDFTVTNSYIDGALQPIQIIGQNGGRISDSYITGDINATLSHNPVISAIGNGTVVTSDINIGPNVTVVDYSTGSHKSAIDFTDVIRANVHNNNIVFQGMSSAGFRGTRSYTTSIHDNNIRSVSYGIGKSIEMRGTGAGNIATNNIVSEPITKTTTGTAIYGNIGYVTEAIGTGTIANGATTTTITHGLSFTPAAWNIVIMPTNNPASSSYRMNYWVDTCGATTCTVHLANDPGAGGFTFGWRAFGDTY